MVIGEATPPLLKVACIRLGAWPTLPSPDSAQGRTMGCPRSPHTAFDPERPANIGMEAASLSLGSRRLTQPAARWNAKLSLELNRQLAIGSSHYRQRRGHTQRGVLLFSRLYSAFIRHEQPLLVHAAAARPPPPTSRHSIIIIINRSVMASSLRPPKQATAGRAGRLGGDPSGLGARFHGNEPTTSGGCAWSRCCTATT